MTLRNLSPSCSGVILSGGLNSRMGGRNKAFLPIGNQTVLEKILNTFQNFFQEILLVTRQPELYRGKPVRIVQDIYEARSSLTGIHAGLVHAQTEFVLVAACDAPFIRPELIRLLLGEIQPESDVIVPQKHQHYEPLCAVYSKRCIPFIEDQLNRSDFKILNFFDKIHLKILPIEKIMSADEEMISFYNLNTPEAYQECLKTISFNPVGCITD
jgi:molybdopterin-guanine dinucleotide biosynthesis protein A